MNTETIRIVNWTQRHWARRELQRFCGRFRLDEKSGLYFDCESPVPQCNQIAQTFVQLPPLIQQAALYLKLTVSTTQALRTLYGDQSAVYGDWNRVHSQISPHLEMTATSLTSTLCFPHLVHECCHLFWAIQTIAARAQYTNANLALVTANFKEVTNYAQDYFDGWHSLLRSDDPAMQQRRDAAREKWLKESFCESAAKTCCPAYKAEENRHTFDLLKARQQIANDTFGLMLDRQFGAD